MSAFARSGRDLPSRVVLALVAALVLLAAGGCATTAFDAERLRARVQSAYADPFRRGDVEAWVAVFTEDALAYHDGPPPLAGRSAIRSFGELVHRNFEIRRFDLVVDEVRHDGDWAMTAGRYTALFVPRSADAYAPAAGEREGKFLLLWTRQKGEWRVFMDMGNSTDRMPR